MGRDAGTKVKCGAHFAVWNIDPRAVHWVPHVHNRHVGHPGMRSPGAYGAIRIRSELVSDDL